MIKGHNKSVEKNKSRNMFLKRWNQEIIQNILRIQLATMKFGRQRSCYIFQFQGQFLHEF